MPLLKQPEAQHFNLPNLSVTGFAAPSRGAQETSVWQLTVAPGSPGTTLSHDREEIIVALSGTGRAVVAGDVLQLQPGDTLIIPANTHFSLGNDTAEPFVAMAALPAGGRASLPGGEPFFPPWAK